jgi:hypothetical protein
MNRLCVVALGLLYVCDSVSNAASAAQDGRFDRSYEPPAPLRYKVDASTLYKAGFSVRYISANGVVLEGGTAEVGPSYPNKCFLETSYRKEFTLSDQFYAHYRARGFSLASLCLAVSSGGWVKYDVETGKPLRLANGFLIDIPDCFRNGAPFLDCTHNFEYTFGLKLKDAERQDVRNRAIDVDAAIHTLIADGKFSRPCTCDDLEIKQHEELILKNKVSIARVNIKGSGYRGQPPVEKFSCRVEHIPQCARDWLAGRDLDGWMVHEVEDGIYFEWTPLKGSTDYGPFDISPKLPHGYAYRIGSPEGDDDSPFLNVTPATKLNVAE